MLSDDVYRAQLAQTFADLLTAVHPLADVAEIGHAASPEFVRLSLLPHAHGACPVEIMLRADQFYDIQIGPEFYEDRRIERFDLFARLIEAIANGNVIQRRTITAATGTERSIETIVTLGHGDIWREGYIHDTFAAVSDASTVFEDRQFVPYRR